MSGHLPAFKKRYGDAANAFIYRRHIARGVVPQVSIIILNRNGKRYLRRCLDALRAQSHQDLEIIFVDNASDDGSVEYVQERYAREIRSGKLRVIRNRVNAGFAEGNNIGWRVARGELIVLLNNDTRAHKHWLRELVCAMRTHPQIMLCGSAYYDTGSRAQWEDAFLRRKMGLSMNPAGEAVPARRRVVDEPRLVAAFFVSGNGVMLRKAQFDRPFYAPYFAYAEDTYLGWLAQLRGGEVVYDVDARMEHLGGGTKRVSTSAFKRELLVHGSKNQLMNPLIFYGWWTLVRALPLIALTQLGHLIDNPRKLGIKCRAAWWVLTHPRTILRERRRVQATRKVPDRAIVARMSSLFFDEHLAQELYRGSHQTAIRALNAFSRGYCRLVRLRTQDLRER